MLGRFLIDMLWGEDGWGGVVGVCVCRDEW